MKLKPDRYVVFLDPSELWTVWDNLRDEPAQLGQNILIGLSEIESIAACRVMNDLDREREETAA